MQGDIIAHTEQIAELTARLDAVERRVNMQKAGLKSMHKHFAAQEKRYDALAGRVAELERPASRPALERDALVKQVEEIEKVA